MARSFNGSSDYIQVAARQWPQSAFTCSCWIYWTSAVTSIQAAMYERISGSDASYMQFAVLNDGTLFSRIQDNAVDAVYIQRNSNAGAITTNSWFNVAMTWDGGTTNGAIKSYSNGTRIDTTDAGAGSFTAAYAGSGVPFTIGAQLVSAAPNFPFPGRIADVAIYNTNLTAGEIASIAKGVRPFNVRPTSLVGYWPLDGIQSPEPDLSGLAKNGSLTGTVLGAGPPITLFTPKPPIFSPFTSAPSAAQIYAFNQTGARFSRNITTIGY